MIVTKELTGVAGIYAPVGPLAAPGPTDLVRLGRLRITATDTPGGPVGGIGSTTVTGGAVSPDGNTVAVRTYTDAYVFSAPDGDAAAALAGAPARIPLPGEPQGEAVSIDDAGRLLSGSEAADGPLPPDPRRHGCARPGGDHARGPRRPTRHPRHRARDETDPGGSGVGYGTGAVLAVLIAAAAVWLVSLFSRRRR